MDAIKKSGTLLRQTWGEQIVGNASIGLIFGVISVLVGIVGFGLAAVISAGAWPLGVGLGAITLAVILALALLSGTLSGIFTVALYRYATTGDAGSVLPGGRHEQRVPPQVTRTFIACLGTETNTFSPIPTGLATFADTMLHRGDATAHPAVLYSDPLHVWRAAAEARGHTVLEGLAAFAEPAGPTTQSVYEALLA